MALTTDDVNAVVALWEEWTADRGFRLSIEVKEKAPAAEIRYGSGGLAAHIQPTLCCLVEIHKGERCVFSERVPHDRAALQASVTVLARTIAGWDGG